MSDEIGLYPKGQFYANTACLKRGMPCFAFVTTNAVLVRKIDKAYFIYISANSLIIDFSSFEILFIK